MDEQKAWIRSRRKRRLRITAAILAVCLLVTTYPDILETISAFAAGLRSDGGVMSITGFVELPEETAQQTVPVGTDRSELELPDTLEAYVSVEAEGDTEDDKKPDDGEQNKDDDEDDGDSDQNNGDQENPDEGGDETGDDKENPDEDNDGNENSGEDNGNGIDGVENEGGEIPGNTEVTEDENSDTGETDSADFSVQTDIFVLPEYQSENVITVETLENKPTTVKEESVTIEGITWQSAPEYDGNAEGIYIFTAVLPEGYAPAEGVSLPQITVTVQGNNEDAVVQALLDRITTLPDVQEYMEKEPDIDNWEEDTDAYEEAYEEWMEGLMAYAEEALAIWEEYEALTQEQQAQIPEELLTKLTAWVELAEQAAGSRKVMAAADGDLKSHTNHTGWTGLSSTSLSRGGNYYLTEDISGLTIPSGVTVNLCLDGHKINKSSSGTVITVESGATLNLYDCQGSGTVSSTYTHGGYGISASDTGTTVNLYGGTVSVVNSSGVYLQNGAHLLVDGAEVKSEFTASPKSPGAAVTIKSGASAEIKSGSVSIENTINSGYNISIIYVDGSLIVSGGTVEETSGSDCRVIAMSSLSATPEDIYIKINGGTINANVFMRSKGNLVVNGTKINGSISLYGGVLKLQDGQSIGSMRPESANIIIGLGNPAPIVELTSPLANQVHYTIGLSSDLDSRSINPRTVTKNFSTYMPGKEPTDVFTYLSSGEKKDHYKIILQDGEVVLMPYVMTFDANGGKLEDSTETKHIITDGKGDITGGNYMRELPAPTRDGYDFDGWYTQKEGGTEVTIDNEPIEEDITVYAHWTPIEYSITYALAGGALPTGKTNPETYTIETAAFTLNNPERDGYTFTGWSGTGLTGTTNKSVKVEKGSMGERAYTANWKAADYTVTYNKNSGTITNESNYTRYTYGTGLTLPTPTRTGYTFGGWYTGSGFSGTAVTQITATDTGNKTYYAKWTANKYTVTFDYQGATGGNTTTSKEVTYDSTYGELPVPEKSSYTFKGWYTQKPEHGEPKGNLVTAETKVATVIYRTLYAYWKDETPPDAPILQDGVNLPTDWTSTQTSIPLTLYDNVGVTELWVKVDAGDYVEVDGFSSDSTAYSYAVKEGNHTYQFKAKDADGNISADSDVFKVMLDTNQPEIDLDKMSVKNGKNLWNWIIGKKSMIIKIPVTDADSGIAEVVYTATADSGEAQTGTIIGEGGYYEIDLGEEFSGIIKLTAKDNAGNITQVSLTADDGKVIAEDYAPVISITLPDAPVPNTGGWYNTSFEITVLVTDDKNEDNAAISGGIAEIKWKDGENGAEKTVPGLPGNTPVFEKDFNIQTIEGTHTYYINAVDNAENDSGWQTVTISLDTIAPAFSVDLSVTNHTQEGADITFTPSEGGKVYWIVDAGAMPAAREVADKGAQNGNEKDIKSGTQEAFTVGGLLPGTTHKVYVVLEDAADNLSEVKEVSFTALQAAPEITLNDITIDHEKEVIKLPEGFEKLEVYTDPSDPEGSRLSPDEDGCLPIKPGTPIYIRYPEKTENNEATPAGDSVKIDIPDRPAKPDEKQVKVTNTTVTVTNPGVGEEYVLVKKGETPDWSEPNTTGQFTELDPNTEYDLYVRKKETDNSFASDPVKTDVRTFVTIEEPVITGEGGGQNGNTASKPDTPGADGETVTFTGTFAEEYTPVIIVGGQEIIPGAGTGSQMTWDEVSGKGKWEYILDVPDDSAEVGIKVEFRKRTMTGITVTPSTLTIYADNAANESIAALTSYLKENSSVQAVYDNNTNGDVQADYSTTGSFTVKGAAYSYTVSAGGKTDGITLNVAPVTASVVVPAELIQVQKDGGYTAEEVSAWLPAQVTVTYTGNGYTERTESRTVTWNTDSIGVNFGAALGRKTINGTVTLPEWANGQDSVSIGIEFVDKYVLTDSQMNLSISGWVYGAKDAPDPKGSVTVADTNPVYTYLYSADNGDTWVTAQNLPKSGSGYIVPGTYRVKMTYTGDSYTGVKTATFIVGRKPIEVQKGTLEALNRNYDGTTDATLKEGGQPVLSGVVAGDTVTLGGSLTVKFTGTGPKKDIPVTVTGFALEGRDAGYYELKKPTLTLYATINNADGTPPSGGSGSGNSGGNSEENNDGGNSGVSDDSGNGGVNGNADNGGDSGNNGGSRPGDNVNPNTPAVILLPAAPPTDTPQSVPETEDKPGKGTKTQPTQQSEESPENSTESKNTDTDTPVMDSSDSAQADNKPQPESGQQMENAIVQTVPASIADGRLVVYDGNGSGDGSSAGSGNPVEGGKIATGNLPGMAGAGTGDQTDGCTNAITILQMYDEGGKPAGKVIVTVVCEEQTYTAGIADTVAVANAVLKPEQIQHINNGKTIEVRVDVKDISETVTGHDKEVIEEGLTEYQNEIPELTIGMYVDISMFIRLGEGGWDAVTSTEELIEVVIGIPKELQEDGREFYIIRSHEGEYTLLNDMDNAPYTVTISTNMFSAYAIAFKQTDTAHALGGNAKCGLCHICPTFLEICYFIWMAVIGAEVLVLVAVIMILRRKKKKAA